MEDVFLVLTGNEFGLDLGNATDLKFRKTKEAEELYESYLEEYGCAGMWKIGDDGLVFIKSEANF